MKWGVAQCWFCFVFLFFDQCLTGHFVRPLELSSEMVPR